jgi:hypothetical protein
VKGIITIKLVKWSDASVSHAVRKRFSIESLGSKVIWHAAHEQLFAKHSKSEHLVCFEAEFAGDMQKRSNYYLPVPPKQIKLTKPTITLSVSGDGERVWVEISTSHIAPFAWLIAGSIKGRFSDNGMLLVPDKPTRVEFIAYEQFSLAALQSTISITTLRDSY